MQGRFEFSGVEVRALLEEAAAAKTRLFTEAQRFLAAGVDLHAEEVDWDGELDAPETGADPGLWLMNDRGVYLRSNAARRKEESVAYAQGYRSEVPFDEGDVCEFIGAESLSQLRSEDTLIID